MKTNKFDKQLTNEQIIDALQTLCRKLEYEKNLTSYAGWESLVTDEYIDEHIIDTDRCDIDENTHVIGIDGIRQGVGISDRDAMQLFFEQ